MAAETLLAFDYGRRRIGVAVGNTLTGEARPLTTVPSGELGPDWKAIDALVAEWRPDRLVVGLPYNADGSESGLGKEARGFALRLSGRCSIPAETIDESLTSSEALDRLRTARRTGQARRRVARSDVDSLAAAVILESWLHNHA